MNTGWNDLIADHFKEHAEVVAASAAGLSDQIVVTGALLVAALTANKKVIAFGNGGSAAQASHLAGELIGRFRETRRPLPALALAADSGVVTCIGNDFGYDSLFERQVEALTQAGDVAIGFTTSGRSENVKRALKMATSKGAITIALTGAAELDNDYAQYILQVPSTSTARVQEIHMMVLHLWCSRIDTVFGNQKDSTK